MLFRSESVERSSVPVDYYVAMGGSAYDAVARMMRPTAATSSALFSELADRFEDLVELLCAMSLHGEKSRKLDDARVLGLVDRYRRFLPITDATPPLSLGEGFTPIVRIENLGAKLGLRNLYVKVEGQNPTGSFKDRGMVVAVAKALEAGAKAIVCASTGNTSASAAAYGAAAGLEVVVVLPAGKIAIGKDRKSTRLNSSH